MACSDNGNKYSGLQWKQECYCGNSNYAKYGIREGCNCSSLNIGANRNCVYEDLHTNPTHRKFSKTRLDTDMICEGIQQTRDDNSKYFDYNDQYLWSEVHGETADVKRFKLFPQNVFNFKFVNQCNLPHQSPIDVCDGKSGHFQSNLNAYCYENHRILTHGANQAGNWRLTDSSKIQPKILGSKLRIEYATRSWGPYETCCGNAPNSYKGWCPLRGRGQFDCGVDLPPLADFAHHWNGYAQINHIDIKFPSEHTLCGKRYDAELVYWFVWPNRKAAINMAILVEIGEFNFELEKLIVLFENEFVKQNGANRNLRTSNVQLRQSLEENGRNQQQNSTHTDRNLYHSLDIFDPFSPLIIRTLWFYAYWGSTTEPPCLGPGGNPDKFV